MVIAKLQTVIVKFCLWIAISFFALNSPGIAAERILLFDSTITLKDDGSLLVREIVKVRAESRNIKRGIYRDFPVRYRDQGGYSRYVSFDIVSIKRDGKAEPYHQTGYGDHTRTYIGSKDVYLKPGIYQYEITYETDRQIRYFREYDELYWNVTGNNWAFPIDKVVARISLPTNAKIINKSAFVGRYGSKNSDYTARSVGQNEMVFKTIKPLHLFEGLTVAVGWPKDVLAEPSAFVRWFWRIWDNIGFVFLAAGTMGVATYFYVMWRWVGRDPEGGVIFPRFKPPEGLSPAVTSYLHFMGFKSASLRVSKAYIAALVSLAVKNRIVIDDTQDDLVVKKGDMRKFGELPPGEQALIDHLLGSRDKIKFKQSNHAAVQGSRQAFKTALLKEHEHQFFKDNYGWFIIGMVASIVVIGISLLLQMDEFALIPLIGLTAVAALGAYLGSMGLRRLWNWIPGGGSRLWGIVFTIIAGVLMLFTVIVPLGLDETPAWVSYCCIALGIMNVSFMHLMRAPTVHGKQIMDEVEGFKLYLSVAEAERWNMDDAPEVDAYTFEQLLPYAIGLGVEEPWSAAFASHLAKVKAPADSYHPHWYSSHSNWNSRNFAATTSGIVSSVSGGMATASPPSSSGSSGGGGFSGGGGGGGGGGGW
ncbi:MAG: DUF2207 domain-containing protein [bacterium]|nr:DUF2207 domain-containing protein [bacterium]